MAEIKESDADDKIQQMMAAAANWKEGRCAQRTIVVLDDWIRRLHYQNGVLACGTYSGDVQLVDFETGELYDTWYAELVDAEADDADDDDEIDQEITALHLSPDAQLVLSGDAAGSVLLRRRGTDNPVMRATHRAAVSGVYWDDDKELVYSTGVDARFHCHDARGSIEASLTFKEPILSLSVSENYAAVGLSDGGVSICTLSPLRQIMSFEAHPGPVSAVNLITQSQLLTGTADGQVCLWRLDEDGDSERQCTTFDGHRGPVVCLHGDGDKVVTGARDGTVRVWDTEEASVRFELRGFTAYLGSLQVSNDWMLADGTNNAIVLLDFSDDAVSSADEEIEG